MDPTEPDRQESMADMAAMPDEELFDTGYLDGGTWQLAEINKSRLPVEVTVSLSRAEVPMRDGLPDPDKPGRVAVSYELAKYEPVPVREEQTDGTRPIVSWKIRVHLRSTYVADLGYGADSAANEFYTLLETDPRSAAALLDRFQKAVAESLQSID